MVNVPSSLRHLAYTAAVIGAGWCAEPAFANDVEAGDPTEDGGIPSSCEVQQPDPMELPGLQEIMNQIDCSVRTTMNGEDLTDNQLLEILKCEEIERVSMTTNNTTVVALEIHLSNGDTIIHEVLIAFSEELNRLLLAQGVSVKTIDGITKLQWRHIMIVFLFGLLVILIAARAINPSFFGKRKKESPLTEKPNVRFSDIGGLSHVKEELEELAYDVMHRKELIAQGLNVSKGVLFTGDPGTGKTLSARALAAEADIPFIAVSGSDMVTKWIGGTAMNIRSLFKKARQVAKKKGSCMLFIDELDAIGGKRGDIDSSAAQEKSTIVNQLLVEMDGFMESEGITVIAATNHPSSLDPALTRPGRFGDRKIHFVPPDQSGRMEIVKVFLRDVEVADNVRLETVASTLVGKTGADIKVVIEYAKRLAAKRDGSSIVVTQADLSASLDRFLMGIESDRVLSDVEKYRVAVHEAGHTVTALLAEGTTVERVSIKPRGPSLGVTLTPPLEEQNLLLRTEMEAKLRLLLAGRVAEMLLLKEESTTAQDDIAKATKLARTMAIELGMASSLNDESFCAVRDYRWGEILDEKVSAAIDHLLNGCEADARNGLEENRELMESIVARLIEQGTIEHAELMELVEEHGAPQEAGREA